MSEKKTYSPIPVLAATFSAAGAAKLVGVGPVRANFARWGYSAWGRRAVGALELGIAAAALRGSGDPTLRQVAGVGSLVTMAGALRTHVRAGDAPLNYVPPLLVALLGVATLTDTTLVVEP